MTLPVLETIELSLADGVLTITLNRPERLNAFNTQMHQELAAAIGHAASNAEVRVIVLTGAGKAFSAGGDMAEVRETPGSFLEGARHARDILFGLLECEKPVIAAVNGDAIGLGATLALVSDIVIAAETARFADPHVKMALVAGDGGAIIWPAAAGMAVAKYYLLTGEMMSAPEALDFRLIARMVPLDTLREETAKLSARLAASAPLALRWTKR